MRRLRLSERLLALASRRGASQQQQEQQLGAAVSISIGDSMFSGPSAALLAAFRTTFCRRFSSSTIMGNAKSPSSVRRAHALAEEVKISPPPSASRRSSKPVSASSSTTAAAAAPKAKSESSPLDAKEKKTVATKSHTQRSTTATTTAKEGKSSPTAATTPRAKIAAAPKAADRWLTASSSSSSVPRNNNRNNHNNNGGGGGNRSGQQNHQQQQRHDPWRLGEGESNNNAAPAAAGRRRQWGNQDNSNSNGASSQWSNSNDNRQRQPWGNNNNNNRRQQHQQQQQTMQQQQEQKNTKRKPSSKPAAPPPPLPPLVIPVGVTSLSLSRLLGVSLEQLNAVLASIDASPPSEEDPIEPDAAELAALELLGGDEGEVASSSPSSSHQQQLRPRRTVVVERPADGDSSNAAAEVAPRPPVVAVLGHVDHGKTSLLDALRKTAVAAAEAGGITQATGAFEVSMPQSNATITFLDTPGHAAFAAMRARGAAMTDVAVLVVDARDGVKPQTREALAHLKSSGVAFVVAITKCDLPDADPSAVRRQLLGEGVELEEVGGAVQVVEVAAVKGQGLRELEEALLLQAELMELKAPRKGLPGSPTEAVVVEARLAQGHGPVATVIVRRGTLEPGQIVAVGREWGKIRSLTDAKGDKNAKEVFPGHAAEVAGLRGVPIAGDRLVVLPTEERARALASARAAAAADAKRGAAAAAVGEQRRKAEEAAAAAAAATAAASPVKVGRRSGGKAAAAQAFADAGEAELGTNGNGNGNGNGTENDPSHQQHQQQNRRLLLVIKADTQGAIEALEESLVSLSTEDVPVRVSASGVGPVTLSDVQHAAAVGGRVLAYGSASAARGGGAAIEREARRLGVPLSCHRVIYHAIDAIAAAVAGAAPPVAREAVAGEAEVLAVFASGGGGGGSGAGKTPSAPVAGLKVVEGAILKAETFRVLRGGKVIHDNLKALTLRRHKLDVERVGAGTECGLVLERGSGGGGGYDPKPGDVVQCVTVEWVSPSAAEVTEAAEAKKQTVANEGGAGGGGGGGGGHFGGAASKKKGGGVRKRKVEL